MKNFKICTNILVRYLRDELSAAERSLVDVAAAQSEEVADWISYLTMEMETLDLTKDKDLELVLDRLQEEEEKQEEYLDKLVDQFRDETRNLIEQDIDQVLQTITEKAEEVPDEEHHEDDFPPFSSRKLPNDTDQWKGRLSFAGSLDLLARFTGAHLHSLVLRLNKYLFDEKKYRALSRGAYQGSFLSPEN